MDQYDSTPAIDVHGYYGTHHRRGGGSDVFHSADGAEVVRRAREVNIVRTIVSSLSALLPRFKCDAVAGNDEAAVVTAQNTDLKQYVVLDPRRDLDTGRDDAGTATVCRHQDSS